MDNSTNEDKEEPRARMPRKEIITEELPAENAYILQIGPITPDSVSVNYSVSVPLVVVQNGNRYILGDITFSPDGSIESTALVRRLSQDTLKFIRRHSPGGFAIERRQVTSGLYTEEPPYSQARGSRLRTPVKDYYESSVQEYKGSFEPPVDDYRNLPYALRKGFSGTDTQAMNLYTRNPYTYGSVNWLRHSVDMEPVTDEQIAAAMKTFPNVDAWNAMISDLLIAQPPVVVSAMNRMFPPEPEGNPYAPGTVNSIRFRAGLAPVTASQITAARMEFSSEDAWDRMLSELLKADQPTVIAIMNDMFREQPE
jgi:hypothetical protein